MTPVLITAINNTFHQHGIRSHFVDSHFEVENEVRIYAELNTQTNADTHSIVQLNIGVESPLLGNGILWNTFAGIGITEVEAEKSAFSKFLLGSFHVIVEALGSVDVSFESANGSQALQA